MTKFELEKIISFALNYLERNFIPNFNSEILASKIRNNFEYLDIPTSKDLANFCIDKYLENKKIVPHYNLASDYLPDSEKNQSSDPINRTQIKKKSELNLKDFSGPSLKLKPDEQKIISFFSEPKIGAYARDKLGFAKSTFHDKIKKLIRLGILFESNSNIPKEYSLTPRFKKMLKSEPVIFRKPSSEIQKVPRSKKTKKSRDEEKDKVGISEASKNNISSDFQISRENLEEYSRLTENPTRFLKFLERFDLERIRSHAYLYSVRIKNPSSKYQMKLKENTYLTEYSGMPNFNWYRTDVKFYNIEAIIRFYPKKIHIRVLEIWSPDPYTSDSIAEDILFRVLYKVSKEYNLRFWGPVQLGVYPIDKDLEAKVLGTHHAFPFHPLAVIAMEKGIHIKTSRLEIDKSKGPELEWTDSRFSSEDCKRMAQEYTIMAETGRYPSIIDKDLQETKKSILQMKDEIRESNYLAEQNYEVINSYQNQIQTLSEKIETSSSTIIKESFEKLTDQIKEVISILDDISYESKETNITLARNQQQPPTIIEIPTFKGKTKQVYELIQYDPGITRKTLANKLKIKNCSISSIVNSLKLRGYIREEKQGGEGRGRKTRGKLYGVKIND